MDHSEPLIRSTLMILSYLLVPFPSMDHSAYVILSSQLVPSDWVDHSCFLIRSASSILSLRMLSVGSFFPDDSFRVGDSLRNYGFYSSSLDHSLLLVLVGVLNSLSSSLVRSLLLDLSY